MRRRTSITDLFIEVAIPVFIIGLIWSFVAFAITVKCVYYPGQEEVLKRVFFFYVMGTVMINRLAGLYGETEKAAIYSVLLVGVMGLFAMVFASRYGAIFGGQSAGEGVLANLAVVIIIGFASYKIARESCLDLEEDPKKTKTDVQLRRERELQSDWYHREEFAEEQKRKRIEAEREESEPVPDKAPKKHPAAWVIYFSLFSMVVFAVGQRLLAEDNIEVYTKAFNCLLFNLLCALALLLLISLSALRLRCFQKKAEVPDGVGIFWAITGVVLIFIVMAFASIPPRPVPEYLARSVNPYEEFPIDEGEEGEKAKSNRTWGGLSKLEAMRIEKRERDIEKLKKEMAGEGEEGDNGEYNPEKEEGVGEDSEEDRREDDEEVSQGRSGAGENQSEGSESGQHDSGKGESDREKSAESDDQKGEEREKQSRRSEKQPSSASTRRSVPIRPPTPTAPIKSLETLGRIIFVVLLIIAFLWALAKGFSAIAGANPFQRLADRFRNLAARLRGLVKRARKPLLSGKKLEAALKAENLYMENPFRNPYLLKEMSKSELVSYTYKAFENFAHVQGYTPEQGQTPIEFIRSLPAEFQEAEFSTLLKMFLRAEYSTHEISDQSIGKLQQVWAKIEV